MTRSFQFACLGFCVALGFLGASACHDASSTPRSERNLRTVVDHTPLTIPLGPIALLTQQDFDEFEARYLPLNLDEGERQRRLEMLWRLYEGLARDADPALKESDAILLQRLALMSYRVHRVNERLPRMLEVLDRLRPAAPESPHTLFALAEIRRLMIPVSPEGVFEVTADSRSWAEGLREQWVRLLERAPKYRGPDGRTATEIRRDLARVEAALEAVSSASEGVSGSDSARLDHGEKASHLVAAARRELWQFLEADDARRRGICRDRRSRLRALDLPPDDPRPLERALDCRCAIELGKVEVALQLLSGLIEDKQVDACRLLRRLAIIAPKPLSDYQSSASLKEAIGRGPDTSCVTLL